MLINCETAFNYMSSVILKAFNCGIHGLNKAKKILVAHHVLTHYLLAVEDMEDNWTALWLTRAFHSA